MQVAEQMTGITPLLTVGYMSHSIVTGGTPAMQASRRQEQVVGKTLMRMSCLQHCTHMRVTGAVPMLPCCGMAMPHASNKGS